MHTDLLLDLVGLGRGRRQLVLPVPLVGPSGLFLFLLLLVLDQLLLLLTQPARLGLGHGEGVVPVAGAPNQVGPVHHAQGGYHHLHQFRSIFGGRVNQYVSLRRVDAP